MKVLWLELNNESVAVKPNKYGGAGRPPAALKEALNKEGTQFFIAGSAQSFADCQSPENISALLPLNDSQIERLKAGAKLADFIVDADTYDLVVHPYPKIVFNLQDMRARQAVWCVGQFEEVAYGHRHILLHNPENQYPKIKNPSPVIHEVVLGVPVGEFEEYKKEDIVVQITNHYPQIHTELIARMCKQLGIPFFFGGPIDQGYAAELSPFMDQYLGVVSEDDKIRHLKRARFFSVLYGHMINETPLAVKQAASYNCAIITTGAGHLSSTIRNGINGAIIRDLVDLKQVWDNRLLFSQQNCYSWVKRRYSLDQMVESFVFAFHNIINE